MSSFEDQVLASLSAIQRNLSSLDQKVFDLATRTHAVESKLSCSIQGSRGAPEGSNSTPPRTSAAPLGAHPGAHPHADASPRTAPPGVDGYHIVPCFVESTATCASDGPPAPLHGACRPSAYYLTRSPFCRPAACALAEASEAGERGSALPSDAFGSTASADCQPPGTTFGFSDVSSTSLHMHGPSESTQANNVVWNNVPDLPRPVLRVGGGKSTVSNRSSVSLAQQLSGGLASELRGRVSLASAGPPSGPYTTASAITSQHNSIGPFALKPRVNRRSMDAPMGARGFIPSLQLSRKQTMTSFPSNPAANTWSTLMTSSEGGPSPADMAVGYPGISAIRTRVLSTSVQQTAAASGESDDAGTPLEAARTMTSTSAASAGLPTGRPSMAPPTRRLTLASGVDGGGPRERNGTTASPGASLKIKQALALDRYFDDEPKMWESLKSTNFYRELTAHTQLGYPLTWRAWLRALMQVQSGITVFHVVRIFEEEDTLSVLNALIRPIERGSWDAIHLVFCSIMHPSSRLRMQWDSHILITLFSVCIITPFAIGFDITRTPTSALGIWEGIVDTTFVVDIYFNFRTAYTCGQIMVTSFEDIARNYLMGFFTLDVISTVPWDLVLMQEQMGLMTLFKATRVIKLIRILRVLKLIRILRLLKAPTILKHLEHRMGRMIVRAVSLTCIVIFILHLFACGFHYVALLDDANMTWILASDIVNPDSTLDRYVTSMYWAMSTMTTVGYGDVTPIQITEKLVSMAGMLIGVTLFAYIMSTVSSLLSTLNAQRLRIQERTEQVDSFCRTHKFPAALALKVKAYYDYVLRRQIDQEDLLIVGGLSTSLRQQVLLTLHAPLLEKIPFLKNKHPQFLEQTLPVLKLEFYAASEYVVWQNDMSTEMYFIVEGLLEVRVNVTASATEDDIVAAEEDSSRQPRNASSLWAMTKAMTKIMRKPTRMRKSERETSRESSSAAATGAIADTVQASSRALQQNKSDTHYVRASKRPEVVKRSRTFSVAGDHALRGQRHPSLEGMSKAKAAEEAGPCGPPAKDTRDAPTAGSSAQEVSFGDVVSTTARKAAEASHEHTARDEPTYWRTNPANSDASLAQFSPSVSNLLNFHSAVVRRRSLAPGAAATEPAAAPQEAAPAGAPSSARSAQAGTATSCVRFEDEGAEDAAQRSAEARVRWSIAGSADRQASIEAISRTSRSVGGRPVGEGNNVNRSGGGNCSDTSVEIQESENPYSAGMRTWLGTRTNAKNAKARSPSSWSFAHATNSRPSASLRPKPRSDRAILDRMIGMDAVPYKRVDRLQGGQYFGEVACWTGQRRTASVVTITTSELYSLTQSMLLSLVNEWPELRNELKFTGTGPPGAHQQAAKDDSQLSKDPMQSSAAE